MGIVKRKNTVYGADVLSAGKAARNSPKPLRLHFATDDLRELPWSCRDKTDLA
jgi:hypothetical protein